MEYKNNKCSVCGEPLPDPIDNRVRCNCCGSSFTVEANNEEVLKIEQYIDESKLENLAHARSNLYSITHEEYLSKDRIKEAILRVKELYPDDIMANFYDSFYKDRDALNKYFSNFDYENNRDYLKSIIEFAVKNLDLSFLASLKELVERAFENDSDSQVAYDTMIEKEAVKLNEGIYNLDIDRDVFLCYSSKDMDKVIEIADFIESQGLNCFIATRNLRHGIGAIENYGEALKKAMRNCKCFLFLSSKNSRSMACDALKYEIPYLKESLPNKPKIQYIFDKPTEEDSQVALALIKSVFNGLEWCKTKDDLITRLSNAVLLSNGEVQKEEKFCVKCLEKNPLSTKHCIKCDCEEFAPTYEEAYKIKSDREAQAYKKQLEEQFKQQQAELEKQRIEEEKKEFKYCVKCLAKNVITTNFCQNCGGKEFESTLADAKVKQEELNAKNDDFKYCVGCLAKNLASAKFCCECGQNEFVSTLEEAKNTKQAKEIEKQQQEEDRKNYKYCTKCLSRNLIATKFCSECANTSFASTLEEAKNIKKTVDKIKKGGVFKFGSYPQGSELPKPIEWDVLEVKDGKALLFSRYILDARRFDGRCNNYASSEVRKWLNVDFYAKAFNSKEKAMILVSDIDNSPMTANEANNPTRWNMGKNPYSCPTTKDKVFLLSQRDITNPAYGFKSQSNLVDVRRQKPVTNYAKKKGAFVANNGNGSYFLRSPSFDNGMRAWACNDMGDSRHYSSVNNTLDGVVPAIWIKI